MKNAYRLKSVLLTGIFTLASLGGLSSAQAGSMNESLFREPLLKSDSLSRWSFTVDYKLLQRDVEPENAPLVELRGNVYSGSIGFDALPWLTLYGAAGGSEAKFHDLESMRSMKFCWAAGLHSYLWNWESDHAHNAGLKLSLDLMAEYARNDSGSDDTQLNWSEISVALPVKLEIATQHYNEIPIDFFSLLLYVGPALSKIDGTREAGGRSVEFSENKMMGAYAGLELYLLENLSLGARVEYFDAATLKATVRYHF